jgi:hypothetical protein
VKSLKAVESCREIHAEIIECFTRFTSDFLQKQIEIAKDIDFGFGSELVRILKPVLPKPFDTAIR